jgi:hypothetical protein
VLQEVVDPLDVVVGELLHLRSRAAPRRHRRRRSGRAPRGWRITSRRTFRIATLPSSADRRTTLTSSLRPLLGQGGMGSRMSLPSFDGWSPRSDSMIAFSIALIWDGVVRLDGPGAVPRAR